MTSMLKNLVEVESRDIQPQPELPPPQKAISRTYPGAPQDDASIELPRLQASSSRPASRPASPTRQASSTSPPSTDQNDVESSRPSTPGQGPPNGAEYVEPLQSMSNPYMNRFRLLAICMINLANGLHDSSTGALIPHMQRYYSIGYAVNSLIFVGQAIGFILAAFFLDALRARLSRAHLMIVGQVFAVATYLPLVVGSPFPAVVVSFALVGFGMSINLAMGNIFCGSLRNATTALGFMHGSYGLGGTVGPIIATAIATTSGSGGSGWFRFYFLTLALAASNLVFAWWSFAGFERDNARVELEHHQATEDPGATLSSTPSASSTQRQSTKSHFLAMFRALRRRIVLLGALFIFAYQGAEVSISGWVISFLIATRDVGDVSAVGYVTAGFWAGITLGRFLLSHPAQRFGEVPFVYLVTAGAGVFQLLVWFVPNIIGGAVSLAIVGFLLGPIYPCSAAVFMRGMDKQLRGTGMVVISAFGSSGGAVAPFTTGMLAQATGTWVMHPIALALFVCMGLCWFGLPKENKRRE